MSSKFFIVFGLVCLLTALCMTSCVSTDKGNSTVTYGFSGPVELLLQAHAIGYSSDGRRKKLDDNLSMSSFESRIGQSGEADREYSGSDARQLLMNSSVTGVDQPFVRFYEVPVLPGNEQGQLFICAYCSALKHEYVDDSSLIGVGYFIGGGVGSVPFEMVSIDEAIKYWFSEWHNLLEAEERLREK